MLTGLGVAGAIGTIYLYKLQRFSGNIDITTRGQIHKLGLEIVIKILVKIKNPTGTRVQIKFPFVKLMDMRGNLLASSQVIDKDVQIEKHSEKTLEPIYFELGMVSLANKVPALLNEFRTTGMFKVIAEIVTKIDNRIPITKKEKLIIGIV
jgi:hypothetical protein